ncbi:cell growth-regulating nucleolar protein [Anopheles moucheti]|uniref:cell growth-regulating nucleolar protein n=1 Tax=Anopheles moucheti TaxID=186751 RepID=UPI0022EFD9DC|nr:cell growth-regulating nucleolar protein [Anopheles moucheti]
MVFFICNYCGESLKKQVVVNHSYRCNHQINVSCMDCQKDFLGQAYDAHTACISEAQKYAPAGYVHAVTKGVKKQEDWISKVRSIPEKHNGLSRGVMNVFEIIKRNDNIPRKQKPFINFFLNSNRGTSRRDVEMAWNLISQEAQSGQQTPAQTNGQEAKPSLPSQNGTSDSKNNGVMQKEMEKEDAPVKQKKETKPSFDNDEAPIEKKQKKSKNAPENSSEEKEPQPTKQKKRKTKDTAENGHEEEEQLPSKQKKRKTKDSSQNGNENGEASPGNETNVGDANAVQQEQNGGGEKFNLGEVIRTLLTTQNNEMKLSKLKKKVMKRYQQATGEEVDGKFEKKFQKKITKTGFVVENDTVRLIEA